jgi:hypothetical protein
LFDFLVIYGREGENSLVRHRLYHKSERLVEIQAFLLFESTDDLAGLIPEDLSMCSTLDLKDLFTREYLTVRRIVLLDPCPVLY